MILPTYEFWKVDRWRRIIKWEVVQHYSVGARTTHFFRQWLAVGCRSYVEWLAKYGWRSVGVMLFNSYALCLMPRYILVVASLANGWQLHISDDGITTTVMLLGVVLSLLLQLRCSWCNEGLLSFISCLRIEYNKKMAIIFCI